MNHSFADLAVSELDRILRTLAGVGAAARPSPAEAHAEGDLTPQDRTHSAALMRVNHVGEVCAQALYQGQRLTARSPENREALRNAAAQEQDHLAWSADRIRELGGRPSLLNPLWYAGSLAMGAASGLLGDRWNLAFLAETERQVEEHLAGHLEMLVPEDAPTRALVDRMKEEERIHRETALGLGGADLPDPVKKGMSALAKVMTTVAYRI